MTRSQLHAFDGGPLPYLLSVPSPDADVPAAWPLLCFLHGYDEGAPTPVREGLTRHGPLSPAAARLATEAFIVVAAQLPTRGDLWLDYAEAVREIVERTASSCGADAAQLFLSGFSYGGNGVLDLALMQPDRWAALWPVDPTRAPRADPGRPIWLSSGAVSRRSAGAFMERLGLAPLQGIPGTRVYLDRGEDHVGTARLAYADERIYRWLLEQRADAWRARR